MTPTNELPQTDTKMQTQRFFAWFTLLPFPIWFLLAVLIWTGFDLTIKANPGSGDALGWLLILVGAIYLPLYFAFILLALIGVILSFTVWRKIRTRFLGILLWINTIMIGLHVLYLAFSFFMG